MLVPVKAFGDAKARLAAVLGDADRERLARWMAARVLAAAGELPTYVACDSEEVASWASDHGAAILWHPGVGLNAAVNDSVAELRAAGVTDVIVAHGDLPRAHSLAGLTAHGTLTLVPDRHGDGTNVIAVPTALPFQFAYGPGSFRRHLAAAIAAGHSVRVRHDALLAADIDTPADLAHPLVQEVLPTWLQTNPANRR
ncbi:MAG: 2-phospho-L-lactate/phosphoenolpyruvate guanylyltransferase [Ilumatobacteraceae bacterium]|nr:2-phospho-L-lactate/phosphoenolpyruvate guanylyltransferase [Ilumatobacteraceae bacterium]